MNIPNEHITFRCKNGASHTYKGVPADGNIVAFIGKTSIIVRCPDSACKHWTVLEFSFPGVNIDLRSLGVVQSTMAPKDLSLKSKKSMVVVE